VAGEHSHDGYWRCDCRDRRPHTFGSGIIIPSAYSQNAKAHEDSWFFTIARW